MRYMIETGRDEILFDVMKKLASQKNQYFPYITIDM